MDLALDYIGADTPIHLQYDIDALDTSEAPSTGTSVPGGLTLEEGKYISKRVHDTGNLIAMDLVNSLNHPMILSHPPPPQLTILFIYQITGRGESRSRARGCR